MIFVYFLLVFRILISVNASDTQENTTSEEVSIDLEGIFWERLSTIFRDMKYEVADRCKRQIEKLDTAEDEIEKCVRPKLKKLIQSTPSFNDEDKEMERIKLIFHDLSNGSPIGANETYILRKHLAEPLCQFVPGLLLCMKPFNQKLLDLCPLSEIEVKKMEYFELILKSLCSKNGNHLLEIIETGGFSCQESILKAGTECIHNYEEFQWDRPNSYEEFCSQLKIIHQCTAEGIDACPNRKPAEIMHAVLKEVKDWVSTSCNGVAPVLPAYFAYFLSLTAAAACFLHQR